MCSIFQLENLRAKFLKFAYTYIKTKLNKNCVEKHFRCDGSCKAVRVDSILVTAPRRTAASETIPPFPALLEGLQRRAGKICSSGKLQSLGHEVHVTPPPSRTFRKS